MSTDKDTAEKTDERITKSAKGPDDCKAATSDKEEKEQVSDSKDKPAISTTEGAAASGVTKEREAVDAIRYYLAEKLGFYDDEDEDDEEDDNGATSTIKILEDTSLSGIARYIQEQKCTKIITMAGAGISTSAGIPDFRSPGSGLYHNLQKYKLPHPQAVFEIDFFRYNPKPFFTLAKELYPGSFKPTPGHYFIRLLHEKGMLLRHYTQNIDTLERVCGLSEEKIVEAHGTFYTSHCIDCYDKYSLEWMKEKIFKDEIPKCTRCEGLVKPDIVFFGENLPPRFFQCAEKDFEACELLIVLGSSLVVQPFASLVDRVSSNCPRLLVNREKAGERNPIMKALGWSYGMDFDESTKDSRDVAWLGDCDDGCQELADLLGWGDELKSLVEQEHKRIDEETSKQ